MILFTFVRARGWGGGEGLSDWVSDGVEEEWINQTGSIGNAAALERVI